MNPLSAWWATAKLYVFGALLVAAGFGYWWHGHESYKAGKLAGDKEVATLKAQYQTAYADAQAAAHTMQAAEDAQELADANARLARQQDEINDVAAAKRRAEASADQFKAKLNDLRKHDPDTAHWLDARIPDSVRTAGKG